MNAEEYTFSTQPYAHQLTAFRRSADARAYAYLMEMGTGKTKVAIDNIAYLWESGSIDCALIVAPNGVHRQWIAEQLPLHLPPRINHRAFVHSAGKPFPAWPSKPDAKTLTVVALNVEALSHKRGQDIVRALVRGHGRRLMIVVDEASRIKSPNAIRTEALVKLGRQAGFRRALTGTPVTQGLHDLWSVFQFLDPAILETPSFTAFKREYCEVEPVPGRAAAWMTRIVGYKNQDDLFRRIAPSSYAVKKEDCLDLPPKVYTTRETRLSPEQRQHYTSLRDLTLTQMDDGTIVSPVNALEKLMRLQQVVCGQLLDADLPCPRFSDAADAVEEAGPALVWCRFRADVRRMAEELKSRGVPFVTHTGDTPMKDRADAIAAFMDGRARVFLATTASGGIGLNLTRATCCIYFSNDFSAERRWQSEDRAHRIGQTSRVTYVDIVAPGTIDRKILGALRAKKNVSDLSMASLRELIAED